MVESDESFIKVTGHMGMYFPIGVVSLNGESNVSMLPKEQELIPEY